MADGQISESPLEILAKQAQSPWNTSSIRKSFYDYTSDQELVVRPFAGAARAQEKALTLASAADKATEPMNANFCAALDVGCMLCWPRPGSTALYA
jgi:hypothetical protein